MSVCVWQSITFPRLGLIKLFWIWILIFEYDLKIMLATVYRWNYRVCDRVYLLHTAVWPWDVDGSPGVNILAPRPQGGLLVIGLKTRCVSCIAETTEYVTKFVCSTLSCGPELSLEVQGLMCGKAVSLKLRSRWQFYLLHTVVWLADTYEGPRAIEL